MKQSNILLGSALVTMALLSGCGKKQEKSEKPGKEMIETEMVETTPDESYVFMNDTIEDVDQFAFAGAPLENSNNNEDFESDTLALNDDSAVRFDKIHFDFNSDKVRADQQQVLHKDIEMAKDLATKGKNIEIRAYRCQMGDAVYNMALSQRSASTIREEMIQHGVPEENIIALGCGQENPLVSSNANDRTTRIEELSPNRRVEISVN